MLTLWDFIGPIRRVLVGVKARPKAPAKALAVPRPRTVRAAATGVAAPKKRPVAARPKAQDTYDAIVAELLAAHKIRVRKWRTSMSGVAWITQYRDGTFIRCLESPRPRSPMSLAIFLHEVGHHVIGLGAYKPRCLEEYHAWMFAVTEMERRGLVVTDRVKRRMDRSLRYAVAKASRRGMKRLPEELRPYAA